LFYKMSGQPVNATSREPPVLHSVQTVSECNFSRVPVL